jgi:hypothetical protein
VWWDGGTGAETEAPAKLSEAVREMSGSGAPGFAGRALLAALTEPPQIPQAG